MQDQILTLKELIGQLDKEKKITQEAVVANVEKFVIPIIHNLRKTENVLLRKYLDPLERNLNALIKPFGTLALKHLHKLTPKEIDICNMIKSGMSNKEIASLLTISPLTVHSHRIKIRTKLGLTNRKVNLISHLNILT